ncbi:polyurethanase [Pseudomonas tolaasii]|uniref:polyurethanase n=1 Tax=Pseudomonas tolaasii TaxID=29442 RepID=UPI001C527E08|nr:polyurethanase [Pseudomonas tolaasii]QXQ20664.1 polyurethanase [Pseudomonas tolaasii]
MGIFKYKNMTNSQGAILLNDALTLSKYAYDSTGQPLATDGWAPISGKVFGANEGLTDKQGTFWGERILAPTANAEVLGKYNDAGKLLSIGIAFRGTTFSLTRDGIGDMFSDLASAIVPEYAKNYTRFAFYDLLGKVASYAQSQNLYSSDILITGHSLGGLATNSMASLSKDCWGGFYKNSNYVAFASPTHENSTAEVLNIGYENDPVFKAIDGKLKNPSVLLWGNDAHWSGAVNNLTAFTDNYASWWAKLPNFLNWGSYSAHSLAGHNEGLSRIIASKFYELTNKDSNIIISQLSSTNRESTWVQDLNRYAEKHTGSTYILGTDGNDLLKGGAGNDYLEGGAGDDRFRDDGGYNIILGGSGNNVFELQKPIAGFNFINDGKGTLYVNDSYAGISITQDIGSFVSTETTYTFWNSIPWSTYEVTYQVTASGLLSNDKLIPYIPSVRSEDHCAFTIANSEGDWLFGGRGDDTLVGKGNNTFVGGEGDDLLISEGYNNTFLFRGDFGKDKIEGYKPSDKLVFIGTPNQIQNSDYHYYASTVGEDLMLSFGESSVTLLGVSISQMIDSNIIIA